MKTKGFALLEVLVAIALVALFLPALGTVLSFSTRASLEGSHRTKANLLAQEGMEAILYLKDKGDSEWEWTSDSPENIAYQLNQSGDEWQLVELAPTPSVIGGLFTRTVTIDSVQYCGNDICESEGAPTDPLRRKITVDVTWSQDPADSVSLTTYVTKY